MERRLLTFVGLLSALLLSGCEKKAENNQETEDSLQEALASQETDGAQADAEAVASSEGGTDEMAPSEGNEPALAEDNQEAASEGSDVKEETEASAG